jgi:phosphoglycolate phosphatase-like HAD superfamily hydrolase
MQAPTPSIIAFDFDGVLCDGLLEYFQTAWQVYCQIWGYSAPPPPGLAEQFYRLRPVVETGWEMPVVIRAVLSGVSESEILAHWSAIAPQVAQETGLTPLEIASQVDQFRDGWIARDLDSWLSLHRFYPGVIERLHHLDETYPVIITTKEERFVIELLQKEGIQLASTQIFGKSQRQPKAQTLRHLIQKFSHPKDSTTDSANDSTTDRPTIWFIEDRLKTLQTIQTQPDLSDVQLFLADWGYNTENDRAHQSDRIHLLSLETLPNPFSNWV